MEKKLKAIGLLVVAVLGLNAWFLWQVAADNSSLPLILVTNFVTLAFVFVMVRAGVDLKIQTEEACRDKITALSDAVESGNYHYSSASPSDDLSVVTTQIDALTDKVRLKAEQSDEALAGLRAQTQSFSSSVENANIGILLVDREQQIKVVNDAMLRMLSAHLGQINTANSSAFIGKKLTAVLAQHSVISRLLSQGSGEPEILRENGLILKLSAQSLGASKETLIQCLDLSGDHLGQEEVGQQLRLASALSAVSTNVMLADEELNIVFLNGTLKELFKANHTKFAAAFPGFDGDHLIGSNIDQFYASPSHQRGILNELSGELRPEISVEDLTFELVVNPIFDKESEQIGTLVEWVDVTLVKEQAEQERINMCMKVVLDNVSTNVMMADNERKIIYVNDSLVHMMREHTDAFQKLSPSFDPDNLLGQNIDKFDKDPSHRQQLQSGQTDRYQTDITVGASHFRLTANPVVDSVGNCLGKVLEWLDITHEKHQQILAAANVRTKMALDSVTTNVMVADEHLNIVYLNGSIRNMLQRVETDLQKKLSQFNAADIIGKNLDIFYDELSHQRHMLGELKQPYHIKIQAGARHFNLIATPVMSEDNRRLGVVVEWVDITQQTIIEKDVQTLVDSVGKGILDTQVTLDGKEGYLLNISEGLNQLSQTISLFVDDIIASIEQMADGNLNNRINNKYDGAFSSLTTALNATIDKLNSVIKEIKKSTEVIDTANSEISKGNGELSKRTEQQASSLEETVASLEELTSNIRDTASNAKIANASALGAKNEATLGERIMNEAMESMAAITESSNRIVEIISVIDEIAFQTNLLALNASVEAARAGEQGRGFAVVANEVRNLAQRSAVSAKEIKELIDVSSERVRTGSGLVNKCAHTLGDILHHANELSSIIGDIAISTNEQATGVGEINLAVAQLDNITQQNSALSEEVASASQLSVAQVEEMVHQVAYFTMDESTTESTSPKKTTTITNTASTLDKSSKSAGAKPKVITNTKPSAKSSVSKAATKNSFQEKTTLSVSGATKEATAAKANKPKHSSTTASVRKAARSKPPIKPAANNTSVSAKIDDSDEWEEF